MPVAASQIGSTLLCSCPANMSAFEYLIADLTRDVNRAQPRDALQFCANWFNARLQEQRTRIRDILEQGNPPPPVSPHHRSRGHSAPGGFSPQRYPSDPRPDTMSEQMIPSRQTVPPGLGPFDEPPRPSNHITHSLPPSSNSPARRPSNHSPFGTLKIPGNAAISPQTSRESSNDAPVQRQFVTIREEDDVSDASSHHSMTLPNPLAKRSSSGSGHGGFLGPPPSALGRRVSVSAESISPSSGPERPPPFFVKTQEQLKRLEEAIKDAFLFRKLDNKKRAAVLGAMKEMHFGTNECVITQGDDGDYFYVVDSGTLDCYKRSPEHDTSTPSTSNADWHPVYGKKVFAYDRGGTFGELALMYYAKRAATVITTSPCTLWALDRMTFQTILLDISARTRRSYETFLASVPLLQSLNDAERAKLADVLQPREFAPGEVVVHEGELGKEFYIVEEGEAEVLKKVRNQQGLVMDEVVNKYKRGDYFGELALLHRTPRAATVRANSSPGQPNLKVAALDADAFTRLLGPLRDLMERSAQAYTTTSSPGVGQ